MSHANGWLMAYILINKAYMHYYFLLNSTFNVISSKSKVDLREYIQKIDIDTKKPQFSIVVPAYNESKRLPGMLPITIEVKEGRVRIYIFLRLSCIVKALPEIATGLEFIGINLLLWQGKLWEKENL